MSAAGQTYDIESFYDGLVEHGLIIPSAIRAVTAVALCSRTF